MFQTLLVHHRGVHKLFLYKTVTKQYSDLLHMWKNWLDSWCKLNMSDRIVTQ